MVNRINLKRVSYDYGMKEEKYVMSTYSSKMLQRVAFNRLNIPNKWDVLRGIFSLNSLIQGGVEIVVAVFLTLSPQSLVAGVIQIEKIPG